METETSIILSLTIYKIISLIVGLTSIYLGYKLFVLGVWGQAGDMNAKFGDNTLILKNAAPGTFFALFGAIIISFTIFKGLEFNKYGTPLGQGNEPNFEILDVTNLPDEPPALPDEPPS
ncbi:MAG: hypothetical protein IH946_02615 [Bacteroidetes bacterium]|nr:hypothetical protein [Bacteroidota bacterium]